MEQGKLSLYSASAGSGKTFTLTQAYLSLIFQDPDSYPHILGITFTNKATAELKDRIITALSVLAKQPESSPYLPHLKLCYAPGITCIQQRAQHLLSSLLHNYSRFNIATIDSFFQQILRSFAYEIDLPGGYEVEMDTTKVLDWVVDALFERLASDHILRKWIVRFTREKLQATGKWKIEDAVRSLAYQLFTEAYQQLPANERAFTLSNPALEKTRSQIYFAHATCLQALQEIGTKGLALIAANGLSKADFAYGAVPGYFADAASGKPVNLQSIRFNQALNADSAIYYTKTSKLQNAIEPLVMPLANYLGELPALQQKLATWKSLQTYINVYGIFSVIEELLQAYRKVHNVSLISDTAPLLQGLISEQAASFIYEKTACNYQHYLLDEFQDTSILQWDNLKPLLAESLAAGHSSLVVGDVKQSIYRFRGGAAGLLTAQLSQDFRRNIQPMVLAYNYRSSPCVVQFNNSVFAQLARRLSEGFGQAASIISKAYAQQVQKPVLKAPQGYVQMQFIAADQVPETTQAGLSGYAQQVLPKLLDLLDNLQALGYQASDIAILVRTSAQARQVAACLLSAKTQNPHAFNFTSKESLQLGSVPAIALLVSAMKWLYQPEDHIHLAQLISLYNQQQNKPVALHDLFGACVSKLKKNEFALLADLLPNALLAGWKDFQKLGLQALSQALIRVFKLYQNPSDFACLSAFEQLIQTFSTQQTPLLGAFLSFWDRKGSQQEFGTANGTNALQMMTIHQAKGLEFNIVILPFCNHALDHETTAGKERILWVSPEAIASDLPAKVPVVYGKTLSESHFAQQHAAEQELAYLDNLNLLYVAFTRSAQALYGFAPLPAAKSNAHMRTVADALFAVLTQKPVLLQTEADPLLIDLPSFWHPETHTFSLGAMQPAKSQIAITQAIIQPTCYISAGFSGKLALRKPVASYLAINPLETSKNQAALSHGSLIHEILSGIDTYNDVQKALSGMQAAGKIDHLEADVLRKNLRSLFKNPVIRTWFRPGVYQQIRCERPILLPDGNQRIPDRVMQKDQHYVVIDFKTGLKQPAHSLQVSGYMNLIAQMDTDAQVQGYLLYLNHDASSAEIVLV